jgi:alpha-D-ribose 1-methylphosphonate 5-triphosphate synthase subunit PhnL
MTAMLEARDVRKAFTLHEQGGAHLPVLEGVCLTVHRGECVALAGASGTGKSTFIRALYGNYRIDGGTILVRDGDAFVAVESLAPHELGALRQRAIGYVSQFLRVIPRVSALDVVAEPLVARGADAEDARERASAMLHALAIPARLWSLSPTTFSGGEKQRVNLARTLVVPFPIVLLDEPTSALDAHSRDLVVALLAQRKRDGAALVGIFHDPAVREALADCEFHVFDGGVR